MHLLRDTEALAAVCRLPLAPELQSLLSRYADALAEFGDDLQADILIIDAGDTVTEAEQAYGGRLAAEGQFAFPVELIDRGEQWVSVVSIYADDGSGLVLLVEIAADTDAELLTACERALAETAP